ncbi:hypothetical protein EQG49_11055 [Periweissella cryptocerci]|uniref:Uncharacterized protein n=1 Tax=Periweissella cryptocerci TaxID=2506420 RepID=A0A4P6YVV1_9LACO|nr:hypothetical protein [Periweissella cryptocerci]QBO36944.1 hypothetical protein EQG49_11055 [Periweissella cryptocerci]
MTEVKVVTMTIEELTEFGNAIAKAIVKEMEYGKQRVYPDVEMLNQTQLAKELFGKEATPSWGSFQKLMRDKNFPRVPESERPGKLVGFKWQTVNQYLNDISFSGKEAG